MIISSKYIGDFRKLSTWHTLPTAARSARAARPHRAPPRLPAANGAGETSLMTTETTHPRLVGGRGRSPDLPSTGRAVAGQPRAPVTPARPGAAHPRTDPVGQRSVDVL